MDVDAVYSDDHLRMALGSFGFADQNVTIVTGGHADPWQVAYTHLHEQTHRKVACSTTFGVLQLLLGQARHARGDRLPEWMAAAASLLGETVDVSWNAHEGYAVYSQLALAALFGITAPPLPLPSRYRAAHEPLARFAASLPPSLRPFEVFVVDAVVMAAFNARVLEGWDAMDGTATALRALLSRPEHQPDARLARLLSALSFDEADGSALGRTFGEIAAARGLPPMPPDALADAAWQTAGDPLQQAFLDAAADWVARRAAERCPELPVLAADEARRTLVAFWDNARDPVAAFGVELLPMVAAPEADSMELEQVRYVGQAEPEREHRHAAEIGAVLGDPGVRGGFCVHVGGRLTALGEEAGFFAHLLGMGKGGGVRSVVLLGGWDDVEAAVWETVGRGRALTLVADAGVLRPADGTLWPPVERLIRTVGLEPLVVAPSTFGTDLLRLLTWLREAGVVRVEQVSAAGVMAVFLARAGTGLEVLFPFPATVLGLLRARHPDIFDWFTVARVVRERQAGDDDVDGAVIESLSDLLLAGSFFITLPEW